MKNDDEDWLYRRGTYSDADPDATRPPDPAPQAGGGGDYYGSPADPYGQQPAASQPSGADPYGGGDPYGSPAPGYSTDPYGQPSASPYGAPPADPPRPSSIVNSLR